MASPQDLQSVALTHNDGSQSSEPQCSRQYHYWDGNKFEHVCNCDGCKKTCTQCGFSRECLHGILPKCVECEELEKRDEAKGDNSQVEQLTLELSKAKEELREGEKIFVLREVLSKFLETEEGKLLNSHLMETAHKRFPKAFPKVYCKSFAREVKIQRFQRANRERFLSKHSRQVVIKEFKDLGSKYWKFVPLEFKWREEGFIFSGETLGHLQSVAKNFEPTEVEGTFKLPLRKITGKDLYNLCMAAAIGDEKAHPLLNSSLNGRADSGEFIFQDHNLGDIVKDIIELCLMAPETTMTTISSQTVPKTTPNKTA